MILGRGSAETVAISPDGETLAVAGNAGVWLYELNTLDLIGLLEWHAERDADFMPWPIAWSPDGRMLAGGSVNGTVSMWDVTTGEELAVLEGHTGHARTLVVNSVAWSPDGRTVARGCREE